MLFFFLCVYLFYFSNLSEKPIKDFTTYYWGTMCSTEQCLFFPIGNNNNVEILKIFFEPRLYVPNLNKHTNTALYIINKNKKINPEK